MQGATKLKNRFWYFYSIKIHSQILHFVALDELYKTVYLGWQNKCLLKGESGNIRSIVVPSFEIRDMPIKQLIRLNNKLWYSLLDSVFDAEYESGIRYYF